MCHCIGGTVCSHGWSYCCCQVSSCFPQFIRFFLVVSLPFWLCRHNVLFKSARALEKCAKLDTIIFDKTGTLTNGAPSVVDVVCSVDPRAIDTMATLSSKSFLRREPGHFLLQVAGSAEQESEHILAKSIVERARESTELVRADDFQVFSRNDCFCLSFLCSCNLSPKQIVKGFGIKASIHGMGVAVGSLTWCEQHARFVNDEQRREVWTTLLRRHRLQVDCESNFNHLL